MDLVMTERKIEKTVFSYKTLRVIMIAFGSFLIAFGGGYAYFIIDKVGFEGLSEVFWPFVCAVLSVPAGIFICIIGKKLRKPILKDDAKSK